MLQFDALRSSRLVRAEVKKVLAYMKENNLFIPDRNWILSLLLPESPAAILDIGPNVYLFTRLLDPEKRKKYSYSAMDIEKRYQDDAVKQVLHDAGKAPWPFPDASFDIILASDIIEHVKETDVFLNEVARLLKPGGEFFISTPNYASLFCIIKVLRGKMFHNPLGRDIDKYCFREHLRFFTHKDLVPYLQHFGLYTRQIITHDLKTDIDFALRNGFWGRIMLSVFNAVSRLSTRFSPEIVLIGSKVAGKKQFVRAG
jgi:SAM-dependent methyltransferase